MRSILLNFFSRGDDEPGIGSEGSRFAERAARLARLFAFLSIGVGSAVGLSACGRMPSSLLRQGQLPLQDFPLYVSVSQVQGSSLGGIYRFDRDASSTECESGVCPARRLVLGDLSNPWGVATDRFNHLYVSEYDNSRVLKVDPDTGEYEVMADGLVAPTSIAVDSVGEVFVVQEGANNIIRLSDRSVYAQFSSRPSSLTFGVDDVMIVGFVNDNRVVWRTKDGQESSVSVSKPVNASLDSTGRVYIAEGEDQLARVLRFHQLSPNDGGTIVAENLTGPQGIAVDPVGNVYVVVAGGIKVISHEGLIYPWVSKMVPVEMAFTKY